MDSDYVITQCPACRAKTASVTAVIHAGKWERSFLECEDCHLIFASSWLNTHEPQSAPSAVQPDEAAVA